MAAVLKTEASSLLLFSRDLRRESRPLVAVFKNKIWYHFPFTHPEIFQKQKDEDEEEEITSLISPSMAPKPTVLKKGKGAASSNVASAVASDASAAVPIPPPTAGKRSLL